MKKIFIILCAFAFVQLSCSRTSDSLGPDACPSDNFAITSSLSIKDHSGGPTSTTELNLLDSYADVTMTFNEVITYKLTITGQTSLAEFVLESKGNSIQEAWYGNSTNGKYFQKGELITCKVTNVCKSEDLGVGQITLTTIIGYNGFGLKVINYEDNPAVATAKYGDCFAGACAGSVLMTPASSGYLASPQGENYYQFKATCTVKPEGVSWYFGGADYTGIDYTSLGDDPTRVYLNFFAKGQANSQAQIILKESLYGSALTRKFLANVSPDGWKLYSVKLSDIGIINPSKISALSFNLGAASFQDASAQVDLDLLIFTLDKPF